MKAHLDYRYAGSQGGLVKLELTLADLHELVDWIEGMAPRDRATHELRELLDALDPPTPIEPATDGSKP